jgi:membrane fusion protein (multidrug efflux system)
MSRQRHANTLTVAPPLPTTLGEESADEWVVSTRMVTEGQYLSIADRLYHLMIRNPLKLRSRVPERYVGQVTLGQHVAVEVMGAVGKAAGKIRRISPAVDPLSRTFEIEALIANEADDLKPGAFAKGNIIADNLAAVVCAPPEAIVMIGGVARLYVLEEGKARERDIQTGRQTDDCTEIVSGVLEGADVIMHGGVAMKDGMPVSVKSTP